uniref:PPM-type phosphatase domain-containing protein n=1 Tax=uncultured Bacteroidota bacterium TaxID=152509 RepID=H5SGK4_9BACT|nr:hypothetical protein HGMM_F25B04C33 [uncultured Bacteroidetes bacterium]
MALFGVVPNLKAPFPGVRWDKARTKIIAKNEAWESLPAPVQEEALLLPAWDFLREGDRIWSKHIVEEVGEVETFFLLPAEGYYEVIQRLEATEREAKFLRDQLHAFVQNVPLPLFVMDPEQDRVIFANNLLLQLLELPLKRLYEGLTLKDILGEAEEVGRALLEKASFKREPLQEIVERPLGGKSRWWIVRAFPFQATNLSGIMIGIVDITREKEQERQLAEAYQELQVQAEELRQNQEALEKAYETLLQLKEEAEQRRKELEDSLLAAQRYQRTLLFRVRELYEAWGYDYVGVVARAHTYIGGDFVVAQRREGWLYVGVGDATGHGTSGALLAITIQSAIHQAILTLASPAHLHEALERAAAQVYEVFEVEPGKDLSNEGAEVALVALPLERQGHLYYATAGRGVYLLSPEGKLSEHVQGRRGVGWSLPGQARQPYLTETLPYLSGSTLFLFSDGITDQLNPQGKRLGKKTFLRWLEESHAAGQDPRAKLRYLLQNWHAWKGEETHQTDDVLIITLAL